MRTCTASYNSDGLLRPRYPMDRTERLYRIQRMLRTHRVVPLAAFLEALEVSRATFKRDLEYLRDRLHAPIVWDRGARGYRFADDHSAGPVHELPGLWFSAGELYALLAAHRLLADITPGILTAQVAPLQSRIEAILKASGYSAQDLGERIRIVSLGQRPVEPRFFAEIALALMRRQRLEIEAWHRGRDEVITRRISPQRLVHYRDNWYLDAWCHLRRALRTFALDTIRNVTVLAEKAKEVTAARLDAHVAAGYGIFAGPTRGWAVLRFSPERARWVQHERWHPRQRIEYLSDGGIRLSVPFSDERELLMDILRHGRHVQVEAPASLRRRVAEEAMALVKRHGS